MQENRTYYFRSVNLLPTALEATPTVNAEPVTTGPRARRSNNRIMPEEERCIFTVNHAGKIKEAHCWHRAYKTNIVNRLRCPRKQKYIYGLAYGIDYEHLVFVDKHTNIKWINDLIATQEWN